MDMLDIGVGGGRTTRHFAPLARTYLGVDYSAAMIARCKREFPSFRFAVADARRLAFAADESYDLVLVQLQRHRSSRPARAHDGAHARCAACCGPVA